MWYWYKNRHTDQWKRIESPEKNPHTYGQLIFSKGGKSIKWEKDSLFSKWCWESWTVACISIKLEHTFTPCRKINSKWHKHLNIRWHHKTPRREHRQNILWYKLYKCFLRSASQGNRNKKNKRDLIKLMSFCTAKEIIKKKKERKTASSISGAGKTGQLHIEEWN